LVFFITASYCHLQQKQDASMTDFFIVRPGDGLYERACSFTTAHYEKRLACKLTRFYPTLFCHVELGEITAVCGIRPAAGNELFLEQYLGRPIEVSLNLQDRAPIVELGGFAAENRLEAFLLMQETAETLAGLGYETVVCTANRPIRGCLKRLGITFTQLAIANAEAVSDADDWGAYYESAPLVLAGSITDGVNAIASLKKALAA